MKRMKIVCILDRSGSMGGIMVEAVAALNTFLKKQKELPGEAIVTLVAFDDQYEVVRNVNLKDCKDITIDEVRPRGMTALNDAIGKTIASTKGKNVVLLIQTDGYENASKEYTTESIKEMIEEKKKKGWDISFIGAGIDAFAPGISYGILRDKCISITKDKRGMADYMVYTNSVTNAYRNS
jgi:hypothetical protein